MSTNHFGCSPSLTPVLVVTSRVPTQKVVRGKRGRGLLKFPINKEKHSWKTAGC